MRIFVFPTVPSVMDVNENVHANNTVRACVQFHSHAKMSARLSYMSVRGACLCVPVRVYGREHGSGRECSLREYCRADVPKG